MSYNSKSTTTSVDNTRIIARNSFWYGFEMAFMVVVMFGVSIPMARIIGPTKLGYFNYIMWLANMSGMIASLGIPTTTRKYMAEYLGRSEPRVARAIFFYTFRTQLMLAAAITAGGLVVVFVFGDPQYRLVSAVQIFSTLPSMAGFVPAQANTATENMRANVFGSVVSQLIYLFGVWISLLLGWNLLGIACGLLLGRSTEFIVRTIPVLRWVRRLPEGLLPPEVRTKMRSFSGQSTILMLLNVVVWDRSDVIFLKILRSNLAEMTFFSVAFNLTEKVMLAPNVFGQALGASLMAQYGRDKSKLSLMVSTATKYMLLCALPLLLGIMALSPAIIRVLYGWQYLPAIPVLAVAALFAVPKPLLLPAQHLLQANERQGFLIGWSLFAGAVNAGADYLLIPKYGALGAAMGNGIGQAVAVAGIWAKVLYTYRLRLETAALLKILFSAAFMAAGVRLLVWNLPPWLALVTGVPVGAVLFLSLVRVTGMMKGDDRTRLLKIAPSIPGLIRPLFLRTVSVIVPAFGA